MELQRSTSHRSFLDRMDETSKNHAKMVFLCTSDHGRSTLSRQSLLFTSLLIFPSCMAWIASPTTAIRSHGYKRGELSPATRLASCFHYSKSTTTVTAMPSAPRRSIRQFMISDSNNSNNNNNQNNNEGDEWVRALRASTGPVPGAFEEEMKMKGLMNSRGGDSATTLKLNANANLIAWLEEHDVYLKESSSWGEAPHPLAISIETKDEITNESSGRGLLLRRDINEGEELLKVPLALCITKKSALEAFPELPSEINDYLAMACHLIHEKFVVGDKSFWKPYLDILPAVQEVNPTFTWSDEDLAFLEGSPVIAATKSMQGKLKREYEALLGGDNGLCQRYPQRFPKEQFTYDRWLWAFTMLFSRAVRLRNMKDGETLAMVPYADLINHSVFSQAFLDARPVGDWLFQTGEEEVILHADRGYRRMEQVYISYGPKSNAELLLLYGFAVERNPFNSVDLTVSIAPRTSSFVKELAANDDMVDPLAEEKVAFLASVGREQTVDFPCYADRYPVELLEYLRLMLMTEEDTRGKPLSEFDYSRAISPANEAAVLNAIIYAIQRQLSKYPSTEDDDAALIKDKAMFRLLSYNQRMAIRHRRNEKRLLKRTIAALEKQLQRQGLDALNLARAEGSTLGTSFPGDEKLGLKQKTTLEERLEKLGLPVDLK